MSLSKRQEERHLRVIRELLKLPENKTCFDCPAKSPVYVNLMNNTFICAQCSGLHRELSHRVKSLSASTFSTNEVSALKEGGNLKARKIWLARLTPQDIIPDLTTVEGVRKFMRQKYVEKRYLDKEAFSVLKKNQSLESLTGSDGKSTYSSPSTSSISLGHIGAPAGLSSPSMSSRVTRGSIKGDHSVSMTSPKLGTIPYSPKMLSEISFSRNIKPLSTNSNQNDFSRAFEDLSITDGSKSNTVQNVSQSTQLQQANGQMPTFNDVFSDPLHGVISSPLPVQETTKSSIFDQTFLSNDQGRTNSLPNPISPTGNSTFDDIFNGYTSPQPEQSNQFNNASQLAPFELKRAETAPAQTGQYSAKPLHDLIYDQQSKPYADFHSNKQHNSQTANRPDIFQTKESAIATSTTASSPDSHRLPLNADPFEALLGYRPASQPQTQLHTDSFDSLFGLTSGTANSTTSASINPGFSSSFEPNYLSIGHSTNNPALVTSKVGSSTTSMVERKGNRNSIPQFFHLSPQSSHEDPVIPSNQQAMDDFLSELTGHRSGPISPPISSTGSNQLTATDSMNNSSQRIPHLQNGSNQIFGLGRGHITDQQLTYKPQTLTFPQGNPALQSYIDPTAPTNPAYHSTPTYEPTITGSNRNEEKSPFQPSTYISTSSTKSNPFSSPHLGHTINRSASLPVTTEGSKAFFMKPGNSTSMKNPPYSLTSSPPSLSSPPIRSESPFTQPFGSMAHTLSSSSSQSPSLTRTNPFSANNEAIQPSNRSPNPVNPFGQNQGKSYNEKSPVTSSSIFGNSRSNHHFGNNSHNQPTSSSFLEDLDPLKKEDKFGGSSLKNESKWYH